MSPERELMLGIDLGTASACMALLDDDGTARVVPNAEGTDRTPTAAHFYDDDDDGLVLGEEAEKMAALDPENTVRYLPTWLGPQERTFVMHGMTFGAQELLALFLMKLKQDASELRGSPIERAVLAVPGHFDDAQRQAVLDAAIISGMDVPEVITRSVASLHGIGLDQLMDPARVMVVNLGGTTFEAAIIDREGDSLQVVAHAADTNLGARDFEQRLSEHLAVSYEEQHAFAANDDEQILQQLLQVGRFAISALATKAHVAVQVGHGQRRMPLKITREMLQSWTADLVARAHRTVAQALASAGCAPSELQVVFLAGSAARLHGLAEALESWTGLPPLVDTDPHTLVARGAARAGAAAYQPDHPGLHAVVPDPTPMPAPRNRPLDDPEPIRSPFAAALGLADAGHIELSKPVDVVTARGIGLIALDRHYRERAVELIPAGTPLPTTFKARFIYAFPEMTAVRVEVTAGPGTTRPEVDIVGAVELRGVPPRPHGTPIEVVLAVGTDQAIDVTVTDTGTKRSVRERFDAPGPPPADKAPVNHGPPPVRTLAE